MQHLQREWYWIIVLVMFFFERDAIIDLMFVSLSLLYELLK